MNVKLLDHTKLSNAVIAARTCWDSFHKGGCYSEATDDITDDDKKLLSRLIFQNKHESISEHIYYNFNIFNMPRFVLVELTRHRICSYSVKSTRYTLKELRKEKEFNTTDIDSFKDTFVRASRYLDLHDDPAINIPQIDQLEMLRREVVYGTSLDECKYLVPESYKCDLVWSINYRSLKNFLELRLNKSAHFRIRDLAKEIYESIPDSHKFLFEFAKEIINKNNTENSDEN